MSKNNDKTLNESLIAINNHIVSMKNVVKKAKVIQMQKIVRKMKLFDKKKGTEQQIEKNKRKCLHLKKEIETIKKIKFNEVAIFALENDSIEFEEYIKKNKIKDIQEVSLARIGLSKPVRQAVDKLKQDSKIDGWKRTFIQYKSRLEKRKNWKEKTKLLKELEEKLVADKIELENDDSNEKNEEEKPNNNEENNIISEKPLAKMTRKQIDDLIRKDEESNRSKREVKFSDSEDEDEKSDDDGEEETSNSSETDYNNENENSDDDDYEDEKEKETDDDLESEHENTGDEKIILNAKTNISQAEKEFKPLVINKKPAHMEIKQINLDQLKDLNEIPIESKSDVIEEDDIEMVWKGDDNEKVETIRVNEDPFFLDPSGNEIQNPQLEEENHKFYERSKRFNQAYNQLDDDNLTSYSSYDRYKNKRKNLAHSSFKNSLSSDSTRFEPFHESRNRSGFRNDNKSFDHYKTDRKNFNKEGLNGRDFTNKNTSRFANQDRNLKNKYNDDDRDRGRFNKRNEKNSFFKKHEEEKKPTLDLANLHPSWQAKKNMEEKLKLLKFEGKKITFDD